MENKTSELSDLFKNIQNGLKQYSLNEFNFLVFRILKTKNSLEKRDEVNYIVAIVCEHYQLSKRNFMTARFGGNSTEARQIASCLLHLNLGLSQRLIANYYSISPRIVNVAIKKFKTIDTKIKTDREFKENYEFLQQKLNTYLIEKNK
jgi:chromosomal replication initiation ATPase DnaA